jgi:hypothetical protein
MSNNRSISFNYNKIRELTSNLKTNLKTKYDKLETITNDINNSNVIENLNAQNSILQTSAIDTYINQIEELFGNFTLDGNYRVTGQFLADTIEVNDIIVRNANNQALSRVVQNSLDITNINQVSALVNAIRSQDLRLNNQTLTNATLITPTINGGTINNVTIDGATITNFTLIGLTSSDVLASKWTKNGNDIYYSYSGNVGIGTGTAISYKLSVIGDCGISTNMNIGGETIIGGDLTVDTNVLKVNTTTNRVGINNATPAYTLDVSGNGYYKSNLIVDGSANIGGFFYVNKENTNVGINNNNPLFDLDVSGTTNITGATTIGGDLTVDTNVFRVDTTNNRVGINNVTPSAPYSLDVSGNVKIRGFLDMSNNIIQEVSGIYFNDGSYIGHGSSFDISSNEIIKFNRDKLVIDTNGNIGIGTTTPTFKFAVTGNTNITGATNIGGDLTVVTNVLKVNTTTNRVGINNATPSAPYSLDVSGNVKIRGFLDMSNNIIQEVSGIYFNDGSYIGHGSSFDISSNEIIKFNRDKLVIDTNGNIGIGTITPTFKFAVTGNTNITGTSKLDGNVGIGTTPHASYKLDVNGTTRLGTNSSTISNIQFGTAELSVDGSANITPIMSSNAKIFVNYYNDPSPGTAPTIPLYITDINVNTFIIRGDNQRKVFWMIIE